MAATKTKAGSTKKQASGSPDVVTTVRALEHGAKALGARGMREGLGRSPEADLALALGYPHYFELVEGGPDGDAAAEATLPATDFSVRTWPREVANRSIRAFGTWAKPDERKTLVAIDGVPSEDDLQAIVTKRIPNQFGWALLYLVEAIYGPASSAAAGLRALESKDEAFVKRFGDSCVGSVEALGHIIRRQPEPEAAKALARLEAIGTRWRGQNEFNKTSQSIRVVTGGRAGAEGEGYRPDGEGKPIAPGSLEWVYDDAAFVADHVKRGGWDESAGPSVRMVVLGGDAVVDYYAASWSKVNAKFKPQAFEDFSIFAPSIAGRILLPLAADAKVGKAAIKWFQARPELDAWVTSVQKDKLYGKAAQAVLAGVKR
jgi:hypothetical protein